VRLLLFTLARLALMCLSSQVVDLAAGRMWVEAAAVEVFVLLAVNQLRLVLRTR
jgi:hypothetical protein